MPATGGFSAALRSDVGLLGAWCSLDSSFTPEIASTTGFDYVCLDLQHGLSEYGSLIPALQGVRAGGSHPIVRVPENKPWMIMKALDMGASGVIVPLVNDAHMAAQAVAAVRYPPDGNRSYGPTRAGLVLGDVSPDTLGACACIVMIETESALDQVEEIAAVPGIDCLYIGPADLSLSLGLPLPGPTPNGEFEAAAGRVLDVATRAGIKAGFHCYNGAAARRRLDQGFGMVTVTSDVLAVRKVLAAELMSAKGDG